MAAKSKLMLWTTHEPHTEAREAIILNYQTIIAPPGGPVGHLAERLEALNLSFDAALALAEIAVIDPLMN